MGASLEAITPLVRGAGSGFAAGSGPRGALAEMFREQLAHGGIARTAAAAPHHDADEVTVAAADVGKQIKARGANIAGLDAIDAVHLTEQMVVVADRMTAPVENRGGEIAVIGRETILESVSVFGLV